MKLYISRICKVRSCDLIRKTVDFYMCIEKLNIGNVERQLVGGNISRCYLIWVGVHILRFARYLELLLHQLIPPCLVANYHEWEWVGAAPTHSNLFDWPIKRVCLASTYSSLCGWPIKCVGITLNGHYFFLIGWFYSSMNTMTEKIVETFYWRIC